MLAKILQKTKGKPCTCQSEKLCTSCKAKKVIHPQVVVEEPRRLPAPDYFTYYNPPKPVYKKSPVIKYLDKSDKKENHVKKIRKAQKTDPSPPICINNFRQWYKRRKALKELAKEKKEEEKREKKRKREELVKERMKHFIKWEAKQKSKSLPPPKKETVHFKDRSASVRPKSKPPAYSKYVTVKKLSRKSSISSRFVNYCYRLCCQLYCYLTCVVLVAFIVIFIV